MTETNRAHGYYSETLDSNSTIAELDQRLQTQRVRLQNATDKLHEEAKKTGLFRSNPSEVHSLQNKADFEAEVLQDIEDEKNLLSRQQRLKAAPFLMDNMSPDLAQYVLTVTIVVRKLPEASQGFWKFPLAKSIRGLRIYI